MKVFISWSGVRSEKAAEALRGWLPFVFQAIEPWMSRADLDAGGRWGREIEQELSKSSFGIICLTPENTGAPWINFEAGAIAKEVEETFVVPYCIDFAPVEIPAGPLTLFQGVRSDEAGTWDLVKSLNKAHKDQALPDDRLRKTFERWWPDLAESLTKIPPAAEPAVKQRGTEEMLSEILETVRGLARRESAAAALDDFRNVITSSLLADLRLSDKHTDELRHKERLNSIWITRRASRDLLGLKGKDTGEALATGSDSEQGDTGRSEEGGGEPEGKND